MKKTLTLLLALCMILSLAACGGKTKAKPEDEQNTPPEDVETPETDKPDLDGALYDLSNPDIDEEISPTYYYYSATMDTQETGLATLLSHSGSKEAYQTNIQAELQKIPLFSRAEVNYESIAQENENEDSAYLFYVQDETRDHEVDIAIYADYGYNYLTYGNMQQIETIDDFDPTGIPDLMQAITGIPITEKDITNAVEIVNGMTADHPDDGVYMVSITDPATYNTIQIALVPYEDADTITVTAARYLETELMEQMRTYDDGTTIEMTDENGNVITAGEDGTFIVQ